VGAGHTDIDKKIVTVVLFLSEIASTFGLVNIRSHLSLPPLIPISHRLVRRLGKGDQAISAYSKHPNLAQ
jgi:hypothetical protein